MFGVYVRFLLCYWNNEGLPNDDVQLASIARISLRRRGSRNRIRSPRGSCWVSTQMGSAEVHGGSAEPVVRQCLEQWRASRMDFLYFVSVRNQMLEIR